ncbi:MAG TPA: hypothetical protein VGF97_07510, partial [Rhizomicrobium sp.]
MSGAQAIFALRGRNPDVLTCIANLSNDLVFTPPEFANRMLDKLAEAWAADHNGSNLWADKKVKFLDPCAKSGVFLREITNRLNNGLANEMPNLRKRVDHILTKQVFGIGTTYLTSLLARRSLYCSKYANGNHSIAKKFDSDAGNIWFKRTEHKWTDGKCKYCGAHARDYDRGEGLETHAYASGLENVNEDLSGLSKEFLPITTKAYLYLSGTPFKALATGEFIEEQIFNWTYTDEQRAKAEFATQNPVKWNPYGALPQMRLLTYQMPDELVAIASGGEFNEFDLNEFFAATDSGKKAQFKHKGDVQKWLDIIRGQYAPKTVESLKTGTRPPFPYSDVRLLPYLQH